MVYKSRDSKKLRTVDFPLNMPSLLQKLINRMAMIKSIIPAKTLDEFLSSNTLALATKFAITQKMVLRK